MRKLQTTFNPRWLWQIREKDKQNFADTIWTFIIIWISASLLINENLQAVESKSLKKEYHFLLFVEEY